MKTAAIVLLAAALACAQGERRLPDSEMFRLEDRYVIGNYLVMGGLLAAATAQLTHDRELSLGFFASSVLLRHAGMPILGLNAEGLCRANGEDGYCANNAFWIYGLNLAAEAVLAYEIAALVKDDYDGLPVDDSRMAIAIPAAVVALGSYVYAWYRFHEVRHRNVPEEAGMSLSPIVAPGAGLGLALQVRFSAP